MKTERRKRRGESGEAKAEFRGRSPLTDLKAAPFSIYGVPPEIERDAREDSLPDREGRALRKVQE